jgi:hypothetical protein
MPSNHAGAPDPASAVKNLGAALVVVLPNNFNAPVLNAAMAPTVPPNTFKNPLRARLTPPPPPIVTGKQVH